MYQKLKKINWINYYILGEQNNSWAETARNPFRGISKSLGTKNINAHSVVDLRIGYIPFENKFVNVYNDNHILLRTYTKNVISKKTVGEYFLKLLYNKNVLFEVKKSHPVDALYLNGFITFSFNLVNKYFPWISFNFRPCHKYYLNFGIGWKGVSEPERSIANFGFKFRIANYEEELKYNPSCVAYSLWEGHI